MSKLKFEIVHFIVILVLLLLNVGGCGGQPLSSKFILKVKKQNPIPKEHVHITFLTPWIVFVGNLGFQSLSRHYKRPCIKPLVSFISRIWKEHTYKQSFLLRNGAKSHKRFLFLNFLRSTSNCFLFYPAFLENFLVLKK